jgi:superfamily I DNA/RNA helicase
LDARTHLLRRSYRTTREIMQFATLLYRLRLADEKDDDILAPDLLNMPTGVFPEIIPLTSPQDEITRLANEVAGFVKQGYPKKHLLLLHSDGNGVKSLVQAINDRLGKDAARDPKTDYPGDYVRVTTLNAGAGLESPIVFLAGLREMFEAEQSLRLSDDEREALIRDNTRKLYMATTRAGQRLVLTYGGAAGSTKSGVGEGWINISVIDYYHSVTQSPDKTFPGGCAFSYGELLPNHRHTFYILVRFV